MEIKENQHTELKNKTKTEECTPDNILENLYVMGNESNYKWLMESKEQLEKGMCAIREL